MKFESSLGKADLMIIWRVYIKTGDGLCCIPVIKSNPEGAKILAVKRATSLHPSEIITFQDIRPTMIAWAYRDGKLVPTRDISKLWKEFSLWWSTEQHYKRLEKRIDDL